jgi:hypothetical protein
MVRHPLGEDDDQRDGGLDILQRGVPHKTGRHEQDGDVHGVPAERGAHGVVDGNAVDLLPTPARRHASHHPRAVGPHIGHVQGRFPTGDPLHEHAAVRLQENAHGVAPSRVRSTMRRTAPSREVSSS